MSESEADTETGPLRRCAVTRQQGQPEDMIRFVVSPSSVITPDLGAKLPGRGIWLSARQDVVEQACKRGVFARAARCQVQIPDDLMFQIEKGLHQRMINVLGLARRAGQSVSGFTKVREMIARQQAAVIVHASDGSEDELRRLLSGARELPVIRTLSVKDLTQAFGRERVVNVALAHGGMASRLCCENGRFIGVAISAPQVRRTFSADGFEQAGQ
ncbi:RNA-binding protein [Acetobacter thailandicus]|uniref:RNA-binding protein n=1 Tax=Acetobacter thailandicus TaxID=1502842 RepID=A0ABT3QGW2_9PROT|nr:RNA-binding protein [Acetobacter thailandicus]MCX2564528.1 RNA-binding protein [Acetobacter thailandicus]